MSFRDYIQAIIENGWKTYDGADWEESKHKRDKGGRFTSYGSSSKEKKKSGSKKSGSIRPGGEYKGIKLGIFSKTAFDERNIRNAIDVFSIFSSGQKADSIGGWRGLSNDLSLEFGKDGDNIGSILISNSKDSQNQGIVVNQKHDYSDNEIKSALKSTKSMGYKTVGFANTDEVKYKKIMESHGGKYDSKIKGYMFEL